MSAPLSPSRSFSSARQPLSAALPRLREFGPEALAVAAVVVVLAGVVMTLTRPGASSTPAIVTLALGLVVSTGIGLWQRAEVRTLRAERARTDLERTSAQLAPHFLFNALNTVNALVREEDRGTTARAVARLGDLVRRTIAFQKPRLVTVDEETTLVRDYLDWERLRHGDALDVELSVDAGALSAAVPGMTIQLLAENAIRHGALAEGDPDRIKIRVRHAEDATIVEVENRMPRDATRPRPGVGIGLVAVQQRLRLAGAGATLERSIAHGHHRAIVRLPRPSATEVRS